MWTTEDYKKSIELDTIIKLQFYPRTPVGSYTIVGYDLDDVVKQGIDMLNRNE